MTNDLMSKRVSVVLPDDVGELLEEMAKEERRSHSQMGAILIEEAVAVRQAKKLPPPVAENNEEPAKQAKKGGK